VTAAMLVVVTGTGICNAQSYPNRPLRFLVGFPPGGTSDILARTIGQKLGDAIGQQVVIENRPGAGGNIGAEAAAKSAADGYTIFMSTTSQAISVSLYSKLNYDLVRDFAPVIQAVNYTNLLVVHPSLPVKSVKELIALAKAKPGQLNYGTAGNGTPPHMTGELFKSYTGVNLQHVPYKGGAPAIADLLGGQITIMFDNVPPLLPHVQAGKMRPLAVTSLKRISVLRDVPTLDEAGLKGFDSVAWNGVLAPAGTPKEIVARLNAEILRILGMSDVRERLSSQGADPVGGTPEQFAALIRDEIRKWAKVVKDSGAKVD
jgi:tripartite-type tricarboxylate transporter receptor subunit TctC